MLFHSLEDRMDIVGYFNLEDAVITSYAQLMGIIVTAAVISFTFMVMMVTGALTYAQVAMVHFFTGNTFTKKSHIALPGVTASVDIESDKRDAIPNQQNDAESLDYERMLSHQYCKITN